MVSASTAYLPWRFLTEQPAHAVVALATLAVGGVVTLLIAWRLAKAGVRTRRSVAIGVPLLAALVLIGSFVFGRVTHTRFGFNLYGLVPVPVLDITVDASGTLWFRDKTHRITADEIRPLLSYGVTDVVIGTGWHQAAKVAPEVLALKGVKVHALATPEAIALFNRMVSEGKKVVLLAHSTC